MKSKVICMVFILVLILSGISYAEYGKCACKFNICGNDLGFAEMNKPYEFVIVLPSEGDVATKYSKDGRKNEVLMISDTQGGLTFMEVTKSGGVIYITTDLHGNAVYSRHIVIQGKLIPSQCYGKCLCLPNEEK